MFSVWQRERGDILDAILSFVSKMWVGRCHMEVYGSCESQIDLTSLDLDIFII